MRRRWIDGFITILHPPAPPTAHPVPKNAKCKKQPNEMPSLLSSGPPPSPLRKLVLKAKRVTVMKEWHMW